MTDATYITPPELLDLRQRIGGLETSAKEHLARIVALEARFGAIESRMTRLDHLIVELGADQHLGFKLMREMLGDVLIAVGVRK
jgi:hypothetical protein